MKPQRGAIFRAVVAGSASILLVAACGGNSGSGSSGGGSATKLVYFMAPNTTPTRYIQQDGPAFEKAMKSLDPSIKVKFVNAGGDSNQQLAQANAAIAAGAKALVVVAADPNTSAGLLQAAAQAKVPVIGYENPPINGTMFAQVIFDPDFVGVQQATYFAQQVAGGKLGAKPVKIARQYGNKGDVYTTQMLAGQNKILDPLIQSGDVKVVCEDYIKDWAPDNATKAAEQCLTKTQNGVNAFFGFYDGITAGIIAALKGKNLKIPVYGGQNPELTGLQYMVTGDQQDDVLKPFSEEATAAAKITIAAVGGQQPPADLVKDTLNNGAMQVPTAKLQSTLIHLEPGQDPGDVVQKAVDLGMFSWAQICTGAAASTATCKAKNP